MVKVSDLVAEFLKENGIKTIFGIIGSANSHIFNSIDELGYTKIINTHHEQAAVMAMGAHYRASGKISAVIVTAGAGATNAITGVVSNWADSIPGIIISGNESTEHIKEHSKLRMYGTQGLNITKMVGDVTKYSHCLMDEKGIQSELEKCLQITMEDRKGPTWLDIPFDLQSKRVNKRPWEKKTPALLTEQTDYSESLINAINSSKRPLILGGNGIRLSGSKDKFNDFINKTNIPTTLSWSGIDLLGNDNPNFFGRFGLYGQKSANYIVQNCDLLIVLGSRLALPQTGYDWDEFIREGKIICVDIQDLQAPKDYIDLHIKENVSQVLDQLLDNVEDILPIDNFWKDYCNNKKLKYPWIGPEHEHNGKYINSYQFIDKLSNHLKDDHIVVTDMGTALLSGHQAIKLKSEQKMFTSLGLGEMGYGIAGAVGAAAACPDKDVLCLNCDGGIMMNLQELHTVIENGLNVKIVIFNNDGYLMIKHTQKMLFNSNYVSVDKNTGIGLPNFSKLLPALGYEYYSLKDWDNADIKINQFLNDPSNSILEVFMDPDQGFLPKVKGVPREDGSILAPPIEDMSPLVPLGELKGEMIVEISKKSKEISRDDKSRNNWNR
jgi:acetolactate synthase I/II/III large subunit